MRNLYKLSTQMGAKLPVLNSLVDGCHLQFKQTNLESQLPRGS